MKMDKQNFSTRRCDELGPWLSAYVDGELEGTEQIPFRCRIEEHLVNCAGCAELASQWSEDEVAAWRQRVRTQRAVHRFELLGLVLDTLDLFELQ